eukprot:393236-Karenia_brevis.AAC.1
MQRPSDIDVSYDRPPDSSVLQINLDKEISIKELEETLAWQWKDLVTKGEWCLVTEGRTHIKKTAVKFKGVTGPKNAEKC